MPRGIIYLETRPVSPDREEEYHKWYNDTHLAEICSVDGIVSARRFAPTDGEGPFIAIYELDCDDLDAVVTGWVSSAGAARCPRWSCSTWRRRRSRRSTGRSGRTRNDRWQPTSSAASTR